MRRRLPLLATLCAVSAPAAAQAPGAAAVPALAPSAATAPPKAADALRVCANPDNLPFSNQTQQGFENKIAQLIGAELGLPVSYVWHAQRRGYLRRTLNAGRCDVVMGAPVGLPSLATTEPYYRSAYVFVTRKDRKLGISSFDDPALKPLRIGLHAVGDDGDNPPPVYSLARRGMARNVVGFKLWDVDGIKNPQGRIIDAVAKGDIDVAIVWGPFAGYFAKQQPIPLTIVPAPTDIAALPLEYSMALGVRTGDDALRRRLDAVLDKRRDDIRAILAGYGVPLVDKPAFAATAATGMRAQGGKQKKE